MADALIARGSLYADVDAVQGERKTEEFAGTGLPNQTITLASTNSAQGSISARVGGDYWAEMPSFVESGMDSRDFVVETDGLAASRIRFGHGYRGMIPYLGHVTSSFE